MTGAHGDLVVLIGNGLPIAVNPALRLDALTAAFLARHAEDQQDLDRLLREVHLGDVDPLMDFEGVVAGLEAAEEVVAAFMGLAARSTHPDLIDAASLLRDRGVPALVRRLYFAYCAEILGAIGEGARVELGAGILAFAEWLKVMYQAHGQLGLFTLNYDLLIERIFVNDDALGLKPALTDFFSGLESRMEMVRIAPDAEPLLGRLFYPEDPPQRPIQLHHLHGCLTHFRRKSDGAIFKFDSAAVREAGIFERLAVAEDTNFTPSTILGSRKVGKSREWPFAYAFLELEQRARAARTIVIAGYSFRDEAVNTRLQAAAQRGERRWIVINKKVAGEEQQFMDQVSALLAPARPEYALEGFVVQMPEPG
ncbi:MAG TPA: SIR2 family protein [Candidatus Limnocylindrales bacterium]|nr:SIR2 family protein [Candidatus Limnocylindrales bacterium]